MHNSLNVSDNDTKNLNQNSRKETITFLDNQEFYDDSFWKSEETKKILNWNLVLSKEEKKGLRNKGISIETINGIDFIDSKTVYGILKILYLQMLELNSLRHENQIFNEIFFKEHSYDCKSGVCYIGKDVNWNGYYKIGKTHDNSCKSRLSKAANPNYRIIYKTKNVDDCNKLEKEIHKFLFKKNVNTLSGCKEWFSLSETELNDLLEMYHFEKIGE